MRDDDDELETAGFDNLMADVLADDEEQHIGMVRFTRCKDSAESEERERRYLESLLSNDMETAALPTPFYRESGEWDGLAPGEAKNLMTRFGITEEEYQAILELKS
jgi:hypothetical protein